MPLSDAYTLAVDKDKLVAELLKGLPDARKTKGIITVSEDEIRAHQLLETVLGDGEPHSQKELQELAVKLSVPWARILKARSESPRRIHTKLEGYPGKMMWRMEPGVRDVPSPQSIVKDRPSTTKVANEILLSKARAMVRKLIELTEEDTGGKCDKCGRSPRSDDVRLKAVLAVLDRAGVGSKAQVTDSTGPLIIFPQGTKLAIAAQTPPTGPDPNAERAEAVDAEFARELPELRLRRASEPDPGGEGGDDGGGAES